MQKKTNMIMRGFLRNLLVTSPALLGFGIMLFSPGLADNIRFSLGPFLAGFTGIIVAMRKKIPMSIGNIQGKWAVIQGVTFTVLLWSIALINLLD